MAQQDEKIPEMVKGTGERVSVGVVYALKSVSSAYYLDGRSGEADPLMTNRKPKGDKYLNWTVQTTNIGYALKSVSSGGYLDGRAGQSDPLMTKRDPTNDQYLQWTFSVTNGGFIAIKSVSSGGYLDGRAGQSDPLMTKRDPMNDKYLQWVFVPMNFKLHSAIDEFDFGDAKEIEKKLEANKQVAFIDQRNITCKETGLKVTGKYGESVQEQFSFGFTETVGVGVETEVSCGVPLLAEAKVKVSATFSFAANQQWTETETKNFEAGYEFTPEKPGIYQVGMMVYSCKNQRLPYNAKVVLSATTDDANNTQYSGAQTLALFKHAGFNCKVNEITGKNVYASISGMMTASYAVSSDVWNKRIGDIK